LFKKIIISWREKVRNLKRQTFAVYLACRDPRTPWLAKALGLLVAGYALNPIDLIPDFIPILGYLDDLILIPLGITLVIRMIPREVMAEYQEKAEAALDKSNPARWVAAAVIIMIWILIIAWFIMTVLDCLKPGIKTI